MENRIIHSCYQCGKEFPHSSRFFCDSCDGFIDVDYDYSRVKIRTHSNPMLKYFDLLPVADKDNILWNGFGNTPCIHARNLGRELGCTNLYLKDETRNPTLTTKDRMASLSLSFLHELGVREFVASSTGNSSTSFAYTINSFPFFKTHLFVSSAFLDRMNFNFTDQIAIYAMADATFVEAFEYAKNYARENNLFAERGFFNPARREGLKLAFLEAVDQMPVEPDWYFQAVSSGMGVFGVYKASLQYTQLGRLKKVPKFCLVQQDTCSPMVKAWDEKSPAILPQHIFPKPSGPARAILRGDPKKTYPHLYEIVNKYGGAFVELSAGEILAAQQLTWDQEQIEICANSACTVAALKKLRENGSIAPDEVVLLNLTGNERSGSAFPQSPDKYYDLQRGADNEWSNIGLISMKKAEPGEVCS